MRNFSMAYTRNYTSFYAVILLLFGILGLIQAQNSDSTVDESGLAASFRPSIAVIIGVLTTMFSLTCLLLLYAKHCKSATGNGSVFARWGNNPEHTGPTADASGSPSTSARVLGGGMRKGSGIDKGVIDALPVFRFAALQGYKDGMECAVCLTRFDEVDLLRLLPKCRHAFHVDCVDTWLDFHSTCPLCRHRVQAEDVLIAAWTRAHDGTDIEAPPSEGLGGRQLSGIFVHREPEPSTAPITDPGAARNDRAIGASGALVGSSCPSMMSSRRYEHRIIVSDVTMFQRRWSDLKPSDLLSKSVGVPADGGRVAGVRTMSEIVDPRRTGAERGGGGGFQRLGSGRSVSTAAGDQRWMSIARRTVQWLAGHATDKPAR